MTQTDGQRENSILPPPPHPKQIQFAGGIKMAVQYGVQNVHWGRPVDWNILLGDNSYCTQNCHLRRQVLGFMDGNFVLRQCHERQSANIKLTIYLPKLQMLNTLIPILILFFPLKKMYCFTPKASAANNEKNRHQPMKRNVALWYSVPKYNIL